jgi:hypothetical protein
MIFLNILRVILFIVSAMLLHPIMALFFCCLSIIRRIIRTIFDIVMFGIIRLLARTPARNTQIAWKISGPGLSRKYYHSISE